MNTTAAKCKTILLAELPLAVLVNPVGSLVLAALVWALSHAYRDEMTVYGVATVQVFVVKPRLQLRQRHSAPSPLLVPGVIRTLDEGASSIKYVLGFDVEALLNVQVFGAGLS